MGISPASLVGGEAEDDAVVVLVEGDDVVERDEVDVVREDLDGADLVLEGEVLVLAAVASLVGAVDDFESDAVDVCRIARAGDEEVAAFGREDLFELRVLHKLGRFARALLALLALLAPLALLALLVSLLLLRLSFFEASLDVLLGREDGRRLEVVGERVVGVDDREGAALARVLDIEEEQEAAVLRAQLVDEEAVELAGVVGERRHDVALEGQLGGEPGLELDDAQPAVLEPEDQQQLALELLEVRRDDAALLL